MNLRIGLLFVAAVLVIVITIAPVTAHEEEEKENQVMDNTMIDHGEDSHSYLITSVTELTALGALAMTAGIISPLGKKLIPVSNNRYRSLQTRASILVGILSIAVGTIHVVLINEHMAESFIWGIAFLVIGVSQLGYGILMILTWRLGSRTKTALYTIGIIGNMLFVMMFVSVRLFTPPFSPEETPVSELEPNGILTVVIEMFMVALLAYLVREKRMEQVAPLAGGS